MARLPDDYDREVYLAQKAIALSTKKAIDERDFDTWKTIKNMYLTSCTETLHEEIGADADWKDDAEMIGIAAEIVGDAMIYFGERVFVRMVSFGRERVLAIVEARDV